MTPSDAVAAFRYHHQWLPDEITFEKGAFSTSLADSLSRMGYMLHPIDKIGAVEMIVIDYTGKLHGAADPRGEDRAAGW